MCFFRLQACTERVHNGKILYNNNKISSHEEYNYGYQVAGPIPIPPRYAFGVFYSRYWAYADTGEMVRSLPHILSHISSGYIFRVLHEAIRNATFHWMCWSLTWTGT